MDAVKITNECENPKRPVKVIHLEGKAKRPKKKPVSLSLDDRQLSKIDGRAAQSGENRSGQITRDLTAYWRLLTDGFKRVQKTFSLDEARYVARIFKGRVLVASDDVLWCDALLSSYVRQSRLYGDAALAESIADKIDACDHFARFAMMDWIRRAAVCADDALFDGFNN